MSGNKNVTSSSGARPLISDAEQEIQVSNKSPRKVPNNPRLQPRVQESIAGSSSRAVERGGLQSGSLKIELDFNKAELDKIVFAPVDKPSIVAAAEYGWNKVDACSRALVVAYGVYEQKNKEGDDPELFRKFLSPRYNDFVKALSMWSELLSKASVTKAKFLANQGAYLMQLSGAARLLIKSRVDESVSMVNKMVEMDDFIWIDLIDNKSNIKNNVSAKQMSNIKENLNALISNSIAIRHSVRPYIERLGIRARANREGDSTLLPSWENTGEGYGEACCVLGRLGGEIFRSAGSRLALEDLRNGNSIFRDLRSAEVAFQSLQPMLNKFQSLSRNKSLFLELSNKEIKEARNYIDCLYEISEPIVLRVAENQRADSPSTALAHQFARALCEHAEFIETLLAYPALVIKDPQKEAVAVDVLTTAAQDIQLESSAGEEKAKKGSKARRRAKLLPIASASVQAALEPAKLLRDQIRAQHLPRTLEVKRVHEEHGMLIPLANALNLDTKSLNLQLIGMSNPVTVANAKRNLTRQWFGDVDRLQAARRLICDDPEATSLVGEMDERVEALSVIEFTTTREEMDALRQYAFPKAPHLERMLELNLIAHVGAPRLLPQTAKTTAAGSEGPNPPGTGTLFEVELQLTPSSTGTASPALYLHAHSKTPLTPEACASSTHDDHVAMHVKTAHQRALGQQWELHEEALGSVHRGKVDEALWRKLQQMMRQD